MTNNRHRICLSKVARWLLKAALLFNLTAFSLYAQSAQRIPTESVKTELVIAGSSAIRPHISYHQLLSKTFKNQVIPGFYPVEMYKVQMICERLLKVAFDSGSKQFFPFRQSRRFQLQKTIPQTSGEDLPHQFAG